MCASHRIWARSFARGPFAMGERRPNSRPRFKLRCYIIGRTARTFREARARATHTRVLLDRRFHTNNRYREIISITALMTRSLYAFYYYYTIALLLVFINNIGVALCVRHCRYRFINFSRLKLELSRE